VSNQEQTLIDKTSFILEKDTSKMKLNDIIEELVRVIESTKKDDR
jgi:DNA-directed RNA polymerase delta subunit